MKVVFFAFGIAERPARGVSLDAADGAGAGAFAFTSRFGLLAGFVTPGIGGGGAGVVSRAGTAAEVSGFGFAGVFGFAAFAGATDAPSEFSGVAGAVGASFETAPRVPLACFFTSRESLLAPSTSGAATAATMSAARCEAGFVGDAPSPLPADAFFLVVFGLAISSD